MNALDLALQKSFPSVMVPRHGPVAPMTGLGERLLIASNGVWLEVVRPWIRLVRRLAVYEVQTPIPYGVVAEETELICGPVSPDLIVQFFRLTREALPNETGAWIVWNSLTRSFSLVPLPARSHGPEHLHYDRPALADGECVVVDCHSHGRAEAYFSRVDNEDDRYDVKLALVIGHCDREPSTMLRLCAKGIFEKFERIPEAWQLAIDAEVDA
jgi:PRTRC genetic system protein A